MFKIPKTTTEFSSLQNCVKRKIWNRDEGMAFWNVCGVCIVLFRWL